MNEKHKLMNVQAKNNVKENIHVNEKERERERLGKEKKKGFIIKSLLQ